MRSVIVFSLALLAPILLTPPARADSTEAPHAKRAVYGEFFGAGMGIMLNYDHKLYPWLSVRGGGGYSFSSGINSGEYANVVASASGIHRLGGSHHLEVSPGIGLLREIGGDRSATAFSLLGGYRYQLDGGGFFGRAQLGPAVFNRSDRDAKTILLFGLALGWSF